MNVDIEDRRGNLPRFFTLEMLMSVLVALAGLVIIWNLVTPEANVLVLFIAGVVFTLAITVLIRLLMDPDSVRARQSNAVLQLASQTLEAMGEGLDAKSSQRICSLLMPSTAAIAVAITDDHSILGYAGYEESHNPTGAIIRTQATYATLADGKTRVLFTPEEIGFPNGAHGINAAIIVPLAVGKDVKGTLKFYYRSANHISETQKSIAVGFGQLLSTQMAASALEEQTALATKMELKMLQSQINPHFLFNTINTIASLTRTDPAQARTLLREFAKFYRSTLEDSRDLIEFQREVEQTQRYFMFELARFGEDRLELICDIQPEVNEMMVPPFLLQPLVENAVRHAMPSEGKLTIRVTGMRTGDDVIVSVIDDGNGMTQEACQNILHPSSTQGMGIAVGNVHDRICGYFGPGTRLEAESELGKGTTVRLVLVDGAIRQWHE
ncbi:histidine kinase [uncultured Senegalimassilia sp.]|uniref:histidine kinase n=1 Tax=uncultured Senegalimassilia sp. TaxID=1714350 RepID=UPI0026DF4102|nr:histidine kinase [uncultured Senegalimassilia sp.]